MSALDAEWNLYRTFLAVVRAGSFSAAARVLASTQPTVSRHIEALEASLGTKLFTRSPRGLRATAFAQELTLHAETMDAAAAAFRRTSNAGTAAASGTIRLTSGAQIGIEILPTILTAFSMQHPQIDLELSISSRNEDLLNRDADLAVRLSRPTQQALVARRLGAIGIGLFAHSSYIKSHGAPRSLADLAHHRLIGFDRDLHIVQAFGGLAATLRREDFAFRTDNVTAQLALLRAGIGIGACHQHLVGRNDGLRPILAKEVGFEREVWLVMHEDLRKTRRAQLLFKYLQRELPRHLGAIAGVEPKLKLLPAKR